MPRGPRALFVIVCGRCDRWLVFGYAPADCVAAGVSLLQCSGCRSCNDLAAAVQQPDGHRHPMADAEPWNRYAYSTWPAVPPVDEQRCPSSSVPAPRSPEVGGPGGVLAVDDRSGRQAACA